MFEPSDLFKYQRGHDDADWTSQQEINIVRSTGFSCGKITCLGGDERLPTRTLGNKYGAAMSPQSGWGFPSCTSAHQPPSFSSDIFKCDRGSENPKTFSATSAEHIRRTLPILESQCDTEIFHRRPVLNLFWAMAAMCREFDSFANVGISAGEMGGGTEAVISKLFFHSNASGQNRDQGQPAQRLGVARLKPPLAEAREV